MNGIGYVVKYGSNQKMYTYNKLLAIKFARKINGEIKKVSSENIKKAIDISI